jgi:ATP-binding cassette subfamily B protein
VTTTTERPQQEGHDPRPAPAEQAREAPLAVKARYAAPRSGIDPDRSLSWLRRALPIVKAHKVSMLTALTMSFIGLVLQVQIPNLLNEAISNSLQARTVPLSHYVYWIVGLGVAAGISSFFSRLYLMRTAYALEFDLRNVMYQHLSRLSFRFYDRAQTGQLISRANSDIRSVQMYLAFAPAILVQCGMAVVAFGYMLSINVPLAFVIAATLPFVYLSGVRMRKALFPVSWLIQSRLAEVATIVDENVNGVRVVKSFVSEQRELTTLARAAERLRWAYVKDADLRARFTPIVQNITQIGLALVLLGGGWLVIHGKLGVGAILAFSAYVVLLQAPFQMLGMLVMLGQRAKASAERIYEVLDEQPDIVDRPDAIDLVDTRGEVVFKDVSFAYGPERPDVLTDLNLTLHPGETVALVGRTGSGKSTVGRLLARFYDVTGGSIMVDGHDLRDLKLETVRSIVGVVPDEPFLFSLSIRDNIAFGRADAESADVVAAAEAAAADGFIGALPEGYETVIGERGYTLSGGQRQRVAIARALLLNPPVLVLDDATSAIDVKTEIQIHSAFENLLAGRTTLLIAHRLSTIGLADRVALLDEGRIVATGTHAELLASSPLYVEVLSQAEGDEWAMEEAEATEANGAQQASTAKAVEQ